MWPIIWGGLIGGIIPTLVTIYFSIKQKRQEAQMKLYEKIYDKKLEIYTGLVNKMRELYAGSNWESDEEQLKFSNLYLSFVDYFQSTTFFIPNQLESKILDLLLLKRDDHEKYSDNLYKIIFETVNIMRDDLGIQKLDSSIKENLKLLQKEIKQK